MSESSIPPLVCAGVFLLLAISVLLRNPHSHVNRAYALWALTTVWWQGAWAILFNTREASLLLTLVRIGYSGIIFIPVTYFGFINALLDLKQSRLTKLSYLVGIVFLILLWSGPQFISGYYEFSWGPYPKAGVLHPVYLVFLSVLAVVGVYLPLKQFRVSASLVQRRMLLYVILGNLAFCLAATDFLVNYGWGFYPVGVIPVLLSAIAYGFMHFRVLDLHLFSHRFIVRLTLALCVVLPLVAVDWMTHSKGLVFGSIFLLSFLGPTLMGRFQGAINKLVDRIPFFGSRYSHFERFADLLRGVENAPNLHAWGQEVLAVSRGWFKARSASVLIREKEDQDLVVRESFGLGLGESAFLSLSSASALVRHLSGTAGVAVAEFIPETLAPESASGILNEMRSIHAALVVPIYYQGRLEAILNLDAKENGEMFNDLDLAHLGNLARAAEHRLEVLLSGMRREQQTAVWAHDLVKPFGPKGSLKEVRALASGGYGEIPERARAMLGRVAEEMAFVGANLKRLIHPNAEEQYNIQQTSLTGVYGRVRDRFQGLATEQGIDWRVSVPPGDIKVLCDEGMIEHRVIGNLVENAFRHTPKGGVVELGYRVEAKTFTGYVKDTGPGIPPEDQEKLFQPGVQLESEVKGLAGLGLYSVKSVLEAQGGKAWVESAPGQGSCFYFKFQILDSTMRS